MCVVGGGVVVVQQLHWEAVVEGDRASSNLLVCIPRRFFPCPQQTCLRLDLYRPGALRHSGVRMVAHFPPQLRDIEADDRIIDGIAPL